jgi:hypothetical protein
MSCSREALERWRKVRQDLARRGKVQTIKNAAAGRDHPAAADLSAHQWRWRNK